MQVNLSASLFLGSCNLGIHSGPCAVSRTLLGLVFSFTVLEHNKEICWNEASALLSNLTAWLRALYVVVGFRIM